RGRGGACHDSGWGRTRNGERFMSNVGAGVSWFAVGGRTPSFNANSTFVNAAAPAPVSRWPTLDFTAPRTQRRSDEAPCHRLFRLSNSALSPTGVPAG